MEHKCTGKMLKSIRVFRFESVYHNGEYIGTAIGKYAVCNKCGTIIKSCSIITGSGQIKELLLKAGEEKQTKNGVITFTQKEFDEIKAEV